MTETNSSAPRRIYACRRCGYMLRYNAPRCGDCYTKAPIYNHSTFWWTLLVGAMLALLVAVVTTAI
ncbi:hypothetical protein GVY41_12305 [Frigidibacter albus]|uniref:Uncharacterized protein n=1 Tax=Frigidibacter albus TaxID=1465486 RepID=A0A6L8VHQ3_9RHOB|nr:hypothetical protein [Frigidibacter albus]MZQ89845.1 hypothetical protein [Frigidibacter albus]NBE31780.1 hypothetical protein [Frigidibacter albus]GGH56372.1 hypothetical protein GCM10011341_24780 [Frigidibacter albus]